MFIPAIRRVAFAKRWLQRSRLWSEPDIARAAAALSAFRILLGTVVLWQAVMTARDLQLLVGEFGLMQRPINQALAPPLLPTVASFHKLWNLGLLSERQVIYILLGMYMISLVYVIAGWRTKIFAAAALFLHLLFKASGFASIYGAHELATNGLFFCMLLPVSTRFTLAKKPPVVDDFFIRVGRTVLRCYLSIVYVSSGIEKVSGPAWRDGGAMWTFLMRPEVTIMNFGWLSHLPWLVFIMGWFVLTVEIGYFFCLFSQRARIMWFFGTLLLHLGICLTFHLWAFSLIMVALNCGALGGFQLVWRRRPAEQPLAEPMQVVESSN
jgi:hypothetical protein